MMCALARRDATRCDATRRGTADAGDDHFLCRRFSRRGRVIQVSIVVDIECVVECCLVEGAFSLFRCSLPRRVTRRR